MQGIALAEGGRGRVTLLFPGEDSFQPALHPAIVAGSLAGLRWLNCSSSGINSSGAIKAGFWARERSISTCRIARAAIRKK